MLLDLQYTQGLCAVCFDVSLYIFLCVCFISATCCLLAQALDDLPDDTSKEEAGGEEGLRAF